VLFFIGNPRNPLVKNITRKAEDVQENWEQRKQDKLLREQELAAELEQQKILAEKERINNIALRAYNSGTIALQQ
jgi:hypothetical protein